MRARSLFVLAAVLATVVLVAVACGGGSKKSSSSSNGGGGGGGNSGGTMLTLAKGAPSGSPDPQVNYTLQEWQWLIFTHDGLLAFKRVGGKEGTKLVPDLAESIPKPTNGGKTYNLSQGVVVNGNTVTFHLTKADPEFFDKLAVPFAFILPASTPTKNVNIPPPGTGPYKWVQYSPQKQIKVVRNSFFKEWSKDAQPEGNPDTIVQKFGLSVEAEVTQVENN